MQGKRTIRETTKILLMDTLIIWKTNGKFIHARATVAQSQGRYNFEEITLLKLLFCISKV